MRFLWALGTGKTLRGRMGLDLGGEKWWGWLDRVVGFTLESGHPSHKSLPRQRIHIRFLGNTDHLDRLIETGRKEARNDKH